MIKLIFLIVVLATGESGRLEYRHTFETVAACEESKASVQQNLMVYLKDEYDLDVADVKVVGTCDGVDTPAKDPDDDTYDAMKAILVEMNRQGGMAHVADRMRGESWH